MGQKKEMIKFRWPLLLLEGLKCQNLPKSKLVCTLSNERRLDWNKTWCASHTVKYSKTVGIYNTPYRFPTFFFFFFFFFCYDTDSPVGETCLNQCHKDNSWRENISVKFSSGKGKTVWQTDKLTILNIRQYRHIGANIRTDERTK